MLARVTNSMKRALVVSMVALVAVGYVACSEDDGADSSLNSNSGPVLTAGPPQELLQSFYTMSPIFATTLGNGSTIRVVDSALSGDSLILSVWYYDDANQYQERMMRFSPNFNGVTLTERKGELVFGYDIKLIAENKSRLHTWEPTKEFIQEVTYGSPMITFSYDIGNSSASFNFSDAAQIDHGNALFQSYIADPNFMATLSTSDSTLLEQMIEADNFVSQNGAPALESDIAVQSLGSEDFVLWSMIASGVDPQPLEIATCDAASLVATVSCALVGVTAGWSALICAPSLGISVACSIAGLMSAWLK